MRRTPTERQSSWSLFRELPDNKFSLQTPRFGLGRRHARRAAARRFADSWDGCTTNGVVEELRTREIPPDAHAPCPDFEGAVGHDWPPGSMSTCGSRAMEKAGLRPLSATRPNALERRPRGGGGAARASRDGVQMPRGRDHTRSSNAAANPTSARPKSRAHNDIRAGRTRARCPIDVYLSQARLTRT